MYVEGHILKGKKNITKLEYICTLKKRHPVKVEEERRRRG